jgi:hypothetical protein
VAPVQKPDAMAFQGSSFSLRCTKVQSYAEKRPPQTANPPPSRRALLFTAEDKNYNVHRTAAAAWSTRACNAAIQALSLWRAPCAFKCVPKCSTNRSH